MAEHEFAIGFRWSDLGVESVSTLLAGDYGLVLEDPFLVERRSDDNVKVAAGGPDP